MGIEDITANNEPNTTPLPRIDFEYLATLDTNKERVEYIASCSQLGAAWEAVNNGNSARFWEKLKNK